MKHLGKCLFLILFLTFSVFGEEPMSYNSPMQIGESLTKSLPKGWSCIYNHSMLIIAYDKKVDLLNKINLPEEPSAELLDVFGFKMSFFFSFHFVNRYTQKEYDSLKKTRNEGIENIKNTNVKNSIKGEDKNSLVQKIKNKYILPEYYNDEYSVFFYKAIEETYIVFPYNVEKESKNILLELEKYLKKYPTENVQGKQNE